jgi:hypothetical protein
MDTLSSVVLRSVIASAAPAEEIARFKSFEDANDFAMRCADKVIVEDCPRLQFEVLGPDNQHWCYVFTRVGGRRSRQGRIERYIVQK